MCQNWLIDPSIEPFGDEHEMFCVPAKSRWVLKLQETIYEDDPIPGMQQLLGVFAKQDIPILYVTGRSRRYWVETHNWLSRWHFPLAPIYMRDNDDWRPAAQYKEETMLKFVSHFTGPVIVFDDDGTGGDCGEMYRRHGWRHLKV